MAKQEPGQFLLDGIGSLDAGVNTGLAPQLLPSNQLAMSTNMTFRGGYGTHRPVIREISLDFKGDSVLEDACIHHSFQGACFYQPDTGAQSLVAAIGGKLFQFFPNGTTAPVLDISVTGDPNPSTPQQAWLWQSERFIIVNDGVSLPIIFDGSSSRRSNGTNKVLATVSGTFIAPAVGATVNVPVTAPYTGPTNIPVLVNGAQFVLLSAASTDPSAQLLYFYDPSPTHHTGEAIIAYPNRLGTLLQAIPAGTKNITVLTSRLVDVNNNPVLSSKFRTTTSTDPRTGITTTTTRPVSTVIIQLGNRTWIVNSTADAGGGNILTTLTLVRFISNDPGSPLIPSGSLVTIASSAPSPTVGTLAADFTGVPNAGVLITVNPTYTGPEQVVWIGSGQYLMMPFPATVSSSVVLQNVTANPGDVMNGNIIGLPELPPGRMGAYGMGRNWMALTDGTSFIASDIVGGTSGTEVYSFRDAPLRVTENTYLAGGGAFRVPGALGDIRAMKFSPTLDVSLGQGPLQVFTTRAAFSCDAPVDRTTWSNVTNPILTQALLGAGALSQNGTTTANGDIIFRAIDGLRSLILARRDFDTWGNVPQSREVETILAQDNATLVQFESLVEFDNRLLLTILPTNGPLGVFHQGIIALNEDPISTLRGKAPSIYDGLWTGMNVLQLVDGVFDGVSRCYAFCFDSVLSRIRLFEIQKTDAAPFDNDTTPVTYSMESASLFNSPKIKNQLEQCELLDGELYISDLRGVANFEVWYRNSFSSCWHKWINFAVCNNNTDTSKPVGYRTRLGLGSPSVQECDPNTKQPARIGLNFQVRVQVTGSCKFRGGLFKSVLVPETRFSVPQCKPICDVVADANIVCEECVDIGDCLEFPLVIYNLNANKTYANDLTPVVVTCPDGSTQTVVVPAGTISYTLPFSPMFTGDFPPLVLNCLSGGVIVRDIPSGATQAEIDDIVNGMISECVNAYAQSIAPCGTAGKLFPSNQVIVLHVCDTGTLTFTGTLPSWITLNADTFQFIGNAGAVVSEVSVDDATAQAQAQLQAWVGAQLTAGNIRCVSGPSCIAAIDALSIDFHDTDGITETQSASVRRLAIITASGDFLTIVNTQTNAVIANTATNIEVTVDGKVGCFSVSTQEFYFPSSGSGGTTVNVYTADGVFVTGIALPANTFNGSNFTYSVDQDTVYTMGFNSNTGTYHIIAINPHTHLVVGDTDTTVGSQATLLCTPGRIILLYSSSSMVSYALPAVTLENTLSLNANGEMAYASISDRIFVNINTFSSPVSFVEINPATMTITKTYTTASIGTLLTFVTFNPVTNAVLFFTFAGDVVVVDPVAQSIVCEFTIPTGDGDGVAVDYSSGDVYLYDAITATNQLARYH